MNNTEVTLSQYQADVFLKTEELYSTIGFRNVALFENEYRLSKDTVMYIKDNIPTNGSSVDTDAQVVYNAVLGITSTTTTTPSGGSTTPSGGSTTPSGGSTTPTTQNYTMQTVGPYTTRQSALQFLSTNPPESIGFIQAQIYASFQYQSPLNVGTELTITQPSIGGSSAYYYIIVNSNEPNLSDGTVFQHNGSSGNGISVTEIITYSPAVGNTGGGSGNFPIDPV